MTRKNYAQRYPLRAKIQSTIAVVALGLLILPVLPKIQITIGSPALAIERGSGR